MEPALVDFPFQVGRNEVESGKRMVVSDGGPPSSDRDRTQVPLIHNEWLQLADQKAPAEATGEDSVRLSNTPLECPPAINISNMFT